VSQNSLSSLRLHPALLSSSQGTSCISCNLPAQLFPQALGAHSLQPSSSPALALCLSHRLVHICLNLEEPFAELTDHTTSWPLLSSPFQPFERIVYTLSPSTSSGVSHTPPHPHLHHQRAQPGASSGVSMHQIQWLFVQL
jgi:hypothetical protein